MMILARLLLKADFGLVNMVTAFTGFLGLFRDAGLSAVTVQRSDLTDAQTSTLFWINVAVGCGLGLLAALAGPALAVFYHEPRLVGISIALAVCFMLNGASAQHRAILQRSLRFSELCLIDVSSVLLGVIAGILMAIAGKGYWALVMLNIVPTAVAACGLWMISRWTPGKPQRGSGIRSMLTYGGTVTLNGVIVYLAYNVDKVLLGRFWGAQALGVYGRACQLINLPNENLNSTIALVAFPALSRIQGDPQRLRSYFLKGYSLFLSLVLPITAGCALFAEDIIQVFLGPRWSEAAVIFRLMSPTILAFALINPFGWLLMATGRATRSLRMAFLIAPVVVLGCLIGLKFGTYGVAAGFSIAMIVLIAPVIVWAKHGTLISGRDLLKSAVMPPFVSILLAGAAIWVLGNVIGGVAATFPRLVLESTILFGVYWAALLFIMKQKAFYFALLRDTGIWPIGLRTVERAGKEDGKQFTES